MNEVEGFERHYLYSKFVNSEYVDDLLDGNLFMSPPRCFIEQEKREKIRGQGDKYEGAHVSVLTISNCTTMKLMS